MTWIESYEARVWNLEIAFAPLGHGTTKVRVSVHRFHGLEGWFGTCHALDVDCHALSSHTVEDAQREFLAYLAQHASALAAALTQAAIAADQKQKPPSAAPSRSRSRASRRRRSDRTPAEVGSVRRARR